MQGLPTAAMRDPSHPEAAAAGGSLFQQNCAFCHGRDAGGGETGPDLTRSKLVSSDVGGDKIGDVVLHGRPDKGMPAFSNFSPEQITQLAAFIHPQQTKAMAQSGKRKGVDVSDLQTGNVEAGKAYFNGRGRLRQLPLAYRRPGRHRLPLRGPAAGRADAVSERCEEQGDGDPSFRAKPFPGTLAYLDEFTVGLRDATGTYRSWPVSAVKVKVDAPVEAHVALFPKYTDADIHNLMAYIQT